MSVSSRMKCEESYVRGREGDWFWFLGVLVFGVGRGCRQGTRIALKELGMYTSPWPCCWPSTMTHEPWKRNCVPVSPGPAPRIPSRLSQFERAHSWKLTTRALPHNSSFFLFFFFFFSLLHAVLEKNFWDSKWTLRYVYEMLKLNRVVVPSIQYWCICIIWKRRSKILISKVCMTDLFWKIYIS